PPEKFSEHISVKTEGCYLCNLKCLRHFIIKNEKYKSDCSAFYRLLPMLSSNWLISNPDTLAHAVALCNDYGVDSNSICNVIGFAMECAEKNLITENINFGNEVAVIELIKKIARRESIGNELAEGIKRYSEKINVTDFAAHVKGLEMSYDARAFPALALGYITSNAGDLPAKLLELEHTKYSSEDFVRVVKYVQEESSVIDSLVMCQLLPLETKDLVELTNATTGLELDEQEYLKIGERIWNLTRVFNVREGISRKDDTLPKRFTQEPLHLSDGKELKITKDEIDRMLSNYYSVRGWDENGIPKKEKLAELGLI
ncbi:MAG: aldehyde ferredoxin oxidoreductase C-terminal domain-containing protein, partial [Candidatus Thermoplasmatota archaeon]